MSTNATTTTSPVPPGSQSTTLPPTTTPTTNNGATTTPISTQTVTASSPNPTTSLITSVVTQTAPNGASLPPSTVVITVVPSTSEGTSNSNPTDGSSGSNPSSTSTSGLTNTNKGSSNTGGLTPGGRTAVAVVVPVVVVALLVLAGLFLWRRRKQRKSAEEARREEVEGYGYNPNNDPTLPAVGSLGDPEMTQDGSGYRGWGNATTVAGSMNRQASTTVSGPGGPVTAAFSDHGSTPGGYHNPGSPTQGAASDHHSGDPLMGNNRDTMSSDELHALGVGPTAGSNRNGDIRRGVSNASSSYSAARGSENSGDGPSLHAPSHEYYSENPYHQPGPYGDNGYGVGQQPVIRDVSARRNTRIENPSVFPQQGNSGIAQNF